MDLKNEKELSLDTEIKSIYDDETLDIKLLSFAEFLEPDLMSGNGISGNGITGNGFCGNGISGNGLCGNGISGNGISGNGI